MGSLLFAIYLLCLYLEGLFPVVVFPGRDRSGKAKPPFSSLSFLFHIGKGKRMSGTTGTSGSLCWCGLPAGHSI
jgi:hypothetical protein